MCDKPCGTVSDTDENNLVATNVRSHDDSSKTPDTKFFIGYMHRQSYTEYQKSPNRLQQSTFMRFLPDQN